MIDLFLWLLTFSGAVALIWFAWRSAMRRRGLRLVEMLRDEGVLRAEVDVPVRITRDGRQTHLLRKRGTLVLTRRRLAGFAHRSRFVFLKGRGSQRQVVRAGGEWLTIRPSGGADAGPEVSFRVGATAEDWVREVARVLRAR